MEERFQAGGKEISLYLSDKRDCPLIVLNTFEGGGAQVLAEARKIDELWRIKTDDLGYFTVKD